MGSKWSRTDGCELIDSNFGICAWVRGAASLLGFEPDGFDLDGFDARTLDGFDLDGFEVGILDGFEGDGFEALQRDGFEPDNDHFSSH